VVPRPGRTVDPRQVADLCRERLAKYKVPRRVEIVDALPLSPQGKVLKKELRRLHMEGGGAKPSKIA
jgi:HIP---CoA ligase